MTFHTQRERKKKVLRAHCCDDICVCKYVCVCIIIQILKRFFNYLMLTNIPQCGFQWWELVWMWRYETEHCDILHFRFRLCSTVMRQNLNLNWIHLMTRPRPWELFKIFSTEEETQGQVILSRNYISLG